MRTNNCTSLSKKESKAIDKFLERLSKRREVVGACLYGSKVAGYGSRDSDIDIIVVVKDYPFAVRYSYFRTDGLKISALIVDRIALHKDAQVGLLGEFVVGRLLHIYESIINHELFKSIEVLYKKRVILEELLDIVRSTNTLCTEISFPLEFILFSKIKKRSSIYPSALYSYYKIYTGTQAKKNLAFALEGYRNALEEIVENDKELLILKESSTEDANLLQISKKSLTINRKAGRIHLKSKLARKLQVLNSYFIHAYAGRRVFHYTKQEAESKIRRHTSQQITLPEFMAYPREYYWKLDEGLIITRSNKRWLDVIAKSSGFLSHVVIRKIPLGSAGSRSVCYTLGDRYNTTRSLSVAVKKFTKLKRVRWGSLNFFAFANHILSRYPLRADPLFRLGIEYKALRYLRNEVGLNTPAILAIDLEHRILITQLVEGRSLLQIIQSSLKKTSAESECILWMREIGKRFAMVHATNVTLGNIKPDNIIINNTNNSNGSIFFTSLDQFSFSENCVNSDPICDIIQFLCWSLKRTNNTSIAKEFTRQFLAGYISYSQSSATNTKASKVNARLIQELSQRSMDYLEQFFPLISSSVARSINEEIRRLQIE
jgi:tRNA A-37 threonylcarbamoyl transferase component Bud32/predicted nucleotidyltransferase